MYPMFRVAEVMDNADPDKLGKVQVKILPELNGVSDESLLPWASSAVQSRNGKTLETGRHQVPEIGSFIKVRINDKYWNSIHYLEEGPSSTESIYDLFAEALDIDELTADMEYPNPNFEKTSDGVLKFHDTSQGILGIQHPSGLFVLIDGDGQLFVKTAGNFKLKNADDTFVISAEEGSLTITAEDVTVETSSFQIGDGADNVALFTPLEEILKKIITANVIAPSGPSTPLQEPNGTPLSALQAKISEIKSAVSTTD